MFDQLRQQWRDFRAQPSGERFQQRYRARASRSGFVQKAFLLCAGLGLILLGIAMIVLPGPGLLAIVIGAGLLADASLLAARLLDRIDLAISRRLARRRSAR
jgi:Flp pilus assembly protein TadB